MSVRLPQNDEEVVAVHEPLNPSENDSFVETSIPPMLHRDPMKPGRLSFWLIFIDSFLNALVHYFGFVVIPILCL